MSSHDLKHPTEEKQRELHEQCRHPAGTRLSLDWRAPDLSIPDQFAAVARSRPDQLAAYDYQSSLTYVELDQAANRVANAILAARGPGQEVVALLVGVDLPAVTAALGVLKAGKAYVALEASFPEARSAYILEDAQVQLILADGWHLAQARELAGPRRQVLQVEKLAAGKSSAPGVPVPLESMAIINYTSGSTGQPKGVVQSHFSTFAQGVCRYSFFHLSDADRVVFRGSLAWAAANWNVFGPLCLGASIGLFDMRQQGLDQIVDWLLETEPSLLVGRALALQLVESHAHLRLPSVRLVTMGGDTIFREELRAFTRLVPNALVTVGLAISEAGRVTELFLDSPDMLQWDVLPLGYPVPGVQIKLLDDQDQEVEPGGVGEIVISSPGLAPGYWRRPELTAARFRPVASLGPRTAYFTGDLGRQTADGLLHHMGRKDFMVKIRGYQVFTNEVEAILRQVDGVSDVCVVAHPLPDSTRRLVAYLVVDRHTFPGVAALYACFQDLPRHMAPQGYVFLDALPKTPTNKPDRARLPLPRRSRLGVTAAYLEPRDEIEEALALIWGQVLDIEGLGVDDNFLELGGDSLDSMRIISQVSSLFQINIPLGEFFQTLTIAEMAAVIRAEIDKT